jgi:hypothetical protein
VIKRCVSFTFTTQWLVIDFHDTLWATAVFKERDERFLGFSTSKDNKVIQDVFKQT